MIKYLVITLVVFVLLFVFQNMQTVDVRFLFWKVSISNALLLFLTIAVGFIWGFLFRISSKSRKD